MFWWMGIPFAVYGRVPDRIIDGDAQSACIAAASIVAK